MTIREFMPGDEMAFRTLNEEWITRYFQLEPKDLESLHHPEKIIQAGGRIFFAVRESDVLGCCALVAMGRNEFEVSKMCVAPAAQGAGVGRLLLKSVIEQARAGGATRLYLESNTKLTPALKLYESVGFQHLPAERVPKSPYSRSNVSMELLLASSCA